MAMSPRLLRPRQAIHPEAADWASRVRANGSSVSGTTLVAVSKFCRAIDSAGIRSRFYRLNLFCGGLGSSDTTRLNACLVPLYRGQSLRGAQYGNTVDGNQGPFFSGDYVETGASGGLKGDGTGKHLLTGLLASLLTPTDSHVAASVITADSNSASYRAILGAVSAGSLAVELYARRSGAGDLAACFGSATNVTNRFGDNVTTATLAAGHIVAAYPTMYRNGTASGAQATANASVGAVGFSVFAGNNQGVVSNFTDARLSSYSIGLGMTPTQVAAFSTAMAAFNSAMRRT